MMSEFFELRKQQSIARRNQAAQVVREAIEVTVPREQRPRLDVPAFKVPENIDRAARKLYIDEACRLAQQLGQSALPYEREAQTCNVLAPNDTLTHKYSDLRVVDVIDIDDGWVDTSGWAELAVGGQLIAAVDVQGTRTTRFNCQWLKDYPDLVPPAILAKTLEIVKDHPTLTPVVFFPQYESDDPLLILMPKGVKTIGYLVGSWLEKYEGLD